MENDEKALTESILDPVRKERCKVLFDDNDVLRPEIKKMIFGIVDEWKKLVNGAFKIKTIYIMGSSAGFQYKDNSDVDVHIESDLRDDSLWKKFNPLLPKGAIIPGTQMPMEFSLETEQGTFVLNVADADDIYDVYTDKWLKKSTPNDVAVPYDYVLQITKFFMSAFDLQFSQLQRDLQEYQTYQSIDLNQVSGMTEKEKKEAVQKMIDALKVDIDTLAVGEHVIKAFRHEAFDHTGEPIHISIDISCQGKLAQKSINNMVFKMFEQFGYKDKSKALRHQVETIINAAEDKIVVPDTKVEKGKEEAAKDLQSNPTPAVPEAKAPAAEPETKTESFNDQDLREILKENNYSPDERNLHLIKCNLGKTYYAVPMTESLSSRTEHSLHRTLYKASGKWTGLAPAVISTLLAGVPGLFIGTALQFEHNKKLDDFQQQVYSASQQDEECQKILSDIKAELEKDDPNKEEIKLLKQKFQVAIKRVAQETKKNNSEMDDFEKVKFIESIQLQDQQIKDLLVENGFYGNQRNIDIAKLDDTKLMKLITESEDKIHTDANGHQYTCDGGKRTDIPDEQNESEDDSESEQEDQPEDK